ncbi:ABC transporter ATP-binding protein [Tautonia plasticadhaerens]|uniref:Teichoic acids export ATP-binding protein TagH n=1 Tax=Tautonia plasticadhaerens TaxID=2527974 RepID=A0A518HFV8_9BACT|nr:ABC transporter ATP-binding protein [Tautonia plasticadhaerens]QDV39705.1 Teichoic acids export ATP-binding protein TagH [Tautonia plasticadhaerens]
MPPAITVQNLSKTYAIGSGGEEPYRTLRESIMQGIGATSRAAGRLRPADSRRIVAPTVHQALDDVSFEVQPGEVIGLVGRNGAGKSTLLKVLSRITEPTSGRVEYRGRLGSLLEVGTGFHLELTGRENVYLNGSILGMSRREIARKFDEIVAFAEIDKFLDTPVKRYSSGMFVRLGFAVAAHFEPEILIVDEVLAVGDAAFQKKCLGKMSDVSREGRTILFVSHNMAAVKSLCSRGVLLDGGRVLMDGDVSDVVNRYIRADSEMAQTGVIPDEAPRHRDVHGVASFRSVRLTDLSGTETRQLFYKQPFRVEFTCDLARDLPDAHWEVSVSTTDGVQVTYSTTLDAEPPGAAIKRGRHVVSAELEIPLLPQDYSIDLGVHYNDGRTADFVRGALDFSVLRFSEGRESHYRWRSTRGFLSVPAVWRTREVYSAKVSETHG